MKKLAMVVVICLLSVGFVYKNHIIAEYNGMSCSADPRGPCGKTGPISLK